MGDRRNRPALLAAPANEVERFLLDAVFQKELRKRQGVHPQHLLVAHRKRGNLAGKHAEERPRLDVVEAPVIHEEFYGRARFRAFLHLIKKHEGAARFERRAAERGEVRDQRLGIEIPFENGFCAGRLNEVDLKKHLVVLPRELADEERLAHLTRARNQQSAVAGRFFPSLELGIDTPRKRHVSPLRRASPKETRSMRRILAEYLLPARRVSVFLASSLRRV